MTAADPAEILLRDALLELGVQMADERDRARAQMIASEVSKLF